MNYYRITRDGDFRQIHVARETKSTVVLSYGMREQKVTGWSFISKDPKACWKWLVSLLEREVAICEARLAYSKEQLKKAHEACEKGAV